MICYKTFEKFYSSDFEKFSDYVSWVNQNTTEKSTVWDWKGKIESPVELGSAHPYWQHIVWEFADKALKEKERIYLLCKEDPELIKFYFGYKKLSLIKQEIIDDKRENEKYKAKINYEE